MKQLEVASLIKRFSTNAEVSVLIDGCSFPVTGVSLDNTKKNGIKIEIGGCDRLKVVKRPHSNDAQEDGVSRVPMLTPQTTGSVAPYPNGPEQPASPDADVAPGEEDTALSDKP